MTIRRFFARLPGDRTARDTAGVAADVTTAPAGVTVGVTGGSVRATVSPWGDVTPWGAGGQAGPGRWSRQEPSAAPPPTLSWHVAADDRWHVPASEPTVRQRRVDGAPVVETRVRVPDGDAVQRVWSVADHGGLTIVEVENDSPLPFAVAFAGLPLLTQRRPADVPVEGIDLPDDAVVMPVGHHASVRIGLAADRGSGDLVAGPLPAVADAAAVARGWLRVTEGASRLEVPDEPLVEAVTAARCDLLLEGPVDAAADPAGFLLDVGELVRLGDDPAAWMPEIAASAEVIARASGPQVVGALLAAGRVARAAGDRRAAGDVDRLLRRRDDADGSPPASFADLVRVASAGRFVHAVESLLATGGALLPTGIPTPWLGHDWAVHGVPSGPATAVSYAIRWHGDRPAVLWEQDGAAVALTAPALAPGWSSAEPAGEALWPAPRPVLRVTSL